MALRLFSRKQPDAATQRARTVAKKATRKPEPYEAAEPMALEKDPLQRHIQLERYGHVVRNRQQWVDHPLVEAAFQAAVEEIDAHFALVPEGFVSLAQTIADTPGMPELDVETNAFLLARTCISNGQFQKFLDNGGYEDLDLWPQDIWPHLIDFKDQTGRTGPRFWREGRHNKLVGDHPVVGICFYEAAAYAKWAGYRLPAGAEWQMAASWRIRSSAHVLRRYPWGDALDISRCNIWASNIGHTVPVTEYESGAAPNGVHQLIGNVWEWTSSDFIAMDEVGRTVVGDMLLKEIRGGAFDTYFPAQAASTFRTGLASLTRAHNVGFRCVVDLTPSDDEAERRPQ